MKAKDKTGKKKNERNGEKSEHTTLKHILPERRKRSGNKTNYQEPATTRE